MASLEARIQGFVHALEQGGFAKWIKLAVGLGVVVGLSLMYLLLEFKGLSTPQGMEQAQIARELARGNGFSTKSVRPLAMWQLASNGRAVPEVSFPDTYHAPLPSFIHAVGLKLVEKKWRMTSRDVTYIGDHVVALGSILFFLGALVLTFLIGKRLFDARLAALGCGLLLLCDLFWQFALSGLPQMQMLFFLQAGLYALVRAIENAQAEKGVGLWISVCGVCFGLLALCHGLAVWLFVGVLLFATIAFRPRAITFVLLLGFFSVVYAPWLLRNYAVSGSPAGVALYAPLGDLKQSEEAWMRTYEPDFTDLTPRLLRRKFQHGVTTQIGGIYAQMGWCIAAPIFFVALLHPFRTRATSSLRWAILLMWVFGVLGACLLGIGEKPVTANNLQVLLVPLMALYGLAMLVVLWNRQPFDHKFLRYSFLTVLFLASSVPMVISIWPSREGKIQWPPYVPPFIAILADWVDPREVIVSDIPWAVGWYADRRSLWVPMRVSDFVRINDYNEAGGPLAGLYLTPHSGDRKFLSEIGKGEFKEWAGFILRNPNTRDFPLKTGTALPVDNECIFFSDRDRWSAGGTP